MKQPLLSDTDTLTFADYFDLNVTVDKVLPFFGYSFEVQMTDFYPTKRYLEGATALNSRLEEALRRVNLIGRSARRQFQIAPILLELVRYTGGRIKVDYPIKVNSRLQGTLDYLLQAKNTLVVSYANGVDLSRGFTQLAVELVALDSWLEQGAFLFGAVSTGRLWQFATLDPLNRRVTKDVYQFRVPEQADVLLHVLVDMLTG
jgi:hypothetical protein